MVTGSGAGSASGRTPEHPSGPRSARLLRWLEVASIVAGLALLLVYAGARLDREVHRFVQLGGVGPAPAQGAGAEVDFSLWAEGRIAKYRESLRQAFAPALGVLRIPRIGLEVPVLDGIDELTLNRAVGHIPGTPPPGAPGNVGIAGHRDGFFRGLKDLALGDRIELEAGGELQRFTVTELTVVDPGDVQVLDPTPGPALTLVTCYPFYFVGKAPQRYIVRAQALSPDAAGRTAGPEGR